MALLVPNVSRFFARGLLALLATCASAGVWAEDDPPGRVGRLAEVSGGEAWLYTPDGGEWIRAERNRPLTTGDRLSTDAAARAEIQIGSTTVRLDGGSELEVLQIDDERMRLQLHGGSAAVRLANAESAGEFRLVTEEGEFQTHRAGRYRFDREDGTTHATVYIGEVLYEGPFSAQTLYGGQRGEFWLDRGIAQYSIVEPRHDEFAAWNEARDGAHERSAATRYVSPEMTGVEDLDHHGRWEQHAEYGPLWIPHAVPVGWAPYSVGHWAWVSPWGWTWVDAAPWGFAPFHYGRWVHHRNVWGWAPGRYVRRPVYAPALVAWIGGPNFSVSISSGHVGPAVGWFPLAPHEIYVPGYRVSSRYVRYLNRGHVDRIDNIDLIVGNPGQAVSRYEYLNRRHHHAVTVVPREALHERRPVGEFRHHGRSWRERGGEQPMLIAAPSRVDRPAGFRGEHPRGGRAPLPPSPVRGAVGTQRRGFAPEQRVRRDGGRRFESSPHPGSASPPHMTAPPQVAAPARMEPPRHWRDHGEARPRGRDHRDGREPVIVAPRPGHQPGFAPAPRQESREPRRHHHSERPQQQREPPMIRGIDNPRPGMAPAMRSEPRGHGGGRRGPPDRATAR